MAKAETANLGQHPPPDGDRAVNVGTGQQADELFSAETGETVWWIADHRRKRADHRLQAAIAGAMAVMVIVGLETVEIDHQQAEWGPGPLRPDPFGGEDVVEGATVEDSGQAIGL